MAAIPQHGIGDRLYHNVILSFVRRLLVSAIFALPFVLAGGYFLAASYYGLEGSQVPQWTSFVVIAVGLALMVIGLYMSFTGIVPSPGLVPGEKQLVMRHPTMKPAYARIVMSIPFFAGALYLGFFTTHPYVYATIPFVVGMYLFFKGTMRYLRNLHITYTVTDRRVVHMYRFLWLTTKEIPVSRIISIAEARNFFEIITGRGSVVVSSGIGAGQIIKIEEINDPAPVAEALRALLP
ncbi:MAG: PH domain-containing protein [Chloroflexota bacterium]|nr:PH domain-containing protein [Chloroflexota bacterium]